jgi:hypothetical protein
VIVVVCTLIVVPLSVFIYKRLAKLIHSMHSSLSSHTSEDLRLTTADIHLLTQMIRQSGFLRPEMEFSIQHAFRVGMNNYLGSDEFTELPAEQHRETAEKLELLESKLGINSREDDQAITTRDILVGSQITVSCTNAEDDIDLIVLENTDRGLLVQPPHPMEVTPESAWILRYFDGVKVWGFTTPILARKNDGLILQHTDEMEMINYRRFARVPVNRSAQVSRFIFHSTTKTQNPLEFMHADVVEIGGPGIMLKSKLAASVGDRILVLLDFGNQETIQAVGKIRRQNDPDPVNHLYCYGVELVGLKPSQIAELMHATNTAAIALHKEKDLSKTTTKVHAAVA